MPRYLLIVGDPESIPYSFQYQLSTQFAVGRICFQEVEEYSQYAGSVVSAETERTLPRRGVVFVPQHGSIPHHDRGAGLIEPLLERGFQVHQRWTIQTVTTRMPPKTDYPESSAQRQLRPCSLQPAMRWDSQAAIPPKRQSREHLFARTGLVPEAGPGNRARSFCFTADDIPQTADLRGMIAFIFAEYGAGTPSLETSTSLSGSVSENRVPGAAVLRRVLAAEAPRPPGWRCACDHRPRGQGVDEQLRGRTRRAGSDGNRPAPTDGRIPGRYCDKSSPSAMQLRLRTGR